MDILAFKDVSVFFFPKKQQVKEILKFLPAPTRNKKGNLYCK